MKHFSAMFLLKKVSLGNIFKIKIQFATESALSGDLPGFECKCRFIKKIKTDIQRMKHTESEKQAGFSGNLQTSQTIQL